MTTLLDINNIITPFSNSPFINDTDNKLLFNFFENYILSDNFLYHINLVNDYFYQQIKINYNYELFKKFKDELYSKIKFYLTQYVKEIRNNIRMRCRINQIDIKYVLDFIKKYNTKIKNLDSILNHFKTPEEKLFIPNKFLGSSVIIELGIDILYNILLTDNSINQILNNTITCKDNDANNSEEVIKNIRTYTNYIKIFNQYGHKYKIYVDTIDDILLQNIPKLHTNTSNIYDIYNFKIIYNYLNGINNKYYTILKDKKFYIQEKFINNNKILIKQLIKIISKQSINELSVFFKIYEQQLQKVITIYPDMYKLFTNFINIDSFQNFIQYSLLVNKLFKQNKECLKIIKILVTTHFKEITDKEIKFCTNIINENIKNNNVEDSSLIYSIFSQSIYEKYIDVFLQYNEEKLIERLVYYNYASKIKPQNEDQNIELLNIYFKEKYLKKFNIILKDFLISQKFQLDNNKSKYYKYTKDIFSLIVTRDIWNININSGFLKLSYSDTGTTDNIEDDIVTVPFSHKLRCENNRFIENSVNKHLIFYPHIGSVNITCEGNKQETNITMLPIQMLFFELFYNSEILEKNLIITKLKPKFKSYNKKVLDDVINSFIESNIIIDLKHINVFQLNLDYNQQQDINLIEIYNNIANVEVIKENKMKMELAYSREKILSTVFNHILKTQSFVLNDLVLNAKKIIKHFSINDILVLKTIKQMEEKEYLTIDNDTQLCKKIDF